MFIGILAALTTCALWGLTFVAPRAVEPFSAWDLTVARYGLFGLASLLLMLHPRFRPSGIPWRYRAVGLLLGGGAYVGYFVSAAFAVRLAGAAIPPLIIGTMPVLLAVIANWHDRALPWRAMLLPLVLIAAGVLTVNVAALSGLGAERRADVLLGILWSTVALGIWIAYGLANAAVMAAPDAPDGLRWTGLQGIGAALGSAALLPLCDFGAALRDNADLWNFIGWSVLMGLTGSWLATYCWVVASRRLPLSLAAQLIVAETVFGLGYGFLFERRWPQPVEWAGSALQMIGVAAAVALFAAAPTRGTSAERALGSVA